MDRPLSSSDQPVIVLMTFPTLESARLLVKALLGKKSIACAHIISGIESHFAWNNSIQEEKEVLVTAKTLSGLFEEIKHYVEEHHPYDVPEIVALPIQHISEKYAAWLKQSCIE